MRQVVFVIISSANTSPVIGARNTAAITAAAPLINIMRRSRCCSPKTPQLSPKPRSDRATTVDTRTLKSCAATESDRCNCGQDFWEERVHVDIAFVLVIGTDDFLGRMFVRIGESKSHDQTRHCESRCHHRKDSPGSSQKQMQQRRPQFFQDDNSDASHCQTGGDRVMGAMISHSCRSRRVGSRQIFRTLAAMTQQEDAGRAETSAFDRNHSRSRPSQFSRA